MSCIVCATSIKMDSTFGINVPNDFHSTNTKLTATSLPDATGSLIGNKNKFMQLARRLKHTLNNHHNQQQQHTSTSCQSIPKKRLFAFTSSSSSSSSSATSLLNSNTVVTHDSTLIGPTVGALAVAATAAVAGPTAQTIVNFAKLSVPTNNRSAANNCSCSSIHSIDSLPNNTCSSLSPLHSPCLSSCSPLDKHRTYRNFCGIRLPASNHHKSTVNTSNGSSRASSISSQNSSLFSSSLNSPSVSSNSNELSLLQTLALCSLELAAPALHNCSLSKSSNRSSNFTSINARNDDPMNHKPPHSLSLPNEFIQLSGHRDGFQKQTDGRVWKKISETPSIELNAYEQISRDPFMASHVATFYGERQDATGQRFVELGDLLKDFGRNAWLMDIKMGTRTFLEKEVCNAEARSDLYDKMAKTLAVGGPEVAQLNLLTDKECEQKALTKLRYMTLREQLSSSSTLGFRIEAYKCSGNAINKDLQYVREANQVKSILNQFLAYDSTLIDQLIDNLQQLRGDLTRSNFFARHELIGSSLLIVHDTKRVGVWMIDFAKTISLPSNVAIDHRTSWQPGNHEDGYLFGLDNLISNLNHL